MSEIDFSQLSLDFLRVVDASMLLPKGEARERERDDAHTHHYTARARMARGLATTFGEK